MVAQERFVYEAIDPRVKDEISRGAQTALVDSTVVSLIDMRPRLVANDYRQGKKVLLEIEDELEKCSSFSFSVAFVTMGGITPLLPYFEELEKRNVPGRILTTDYLSFSEPRALKKLAEFKNIEVRMFKTVSDTSTVGFHTKGYIFERDDKTVHAIVGSSNLTQTALTSNKEWNLKFVSAQHGELIQETQNAFKELWALSISLDEYIDAYSKMYFEKQQIIKEQPIVPIEQILLEPNSMQVEFISRLDEYINNGAQRVLLVSATGTGKTYASAFAVRHIAPKKVLFLVHREQILRDAQQSYINVFGPNLSTGILSGNSHEWDADYIFSTIQTMSRDNYLHKFAPDYFDMIIIDEVHRAGGATYQKVLQYFTPKLCLGMSATPERTDGYDIYQLFDNNLVYEIRLQQALEENLLCPFHYFGITDIEIDGEIVDDSDLSINDLVNDRRVDHLLEKAKLYGYSGSRLKGLIFCRTNAESKELSEALNRRGYRTLALSGADSQDARSRAVERLVCNEDHPLYDEHLDYILTVDIFNEGIDIPDVNQIIMIRPTESAIVFVQQLGRGLRKSVDKEFVVIIDFIGNYKNSYLIPVALTGDKSFNKDSMRRDVLEGSRMMPDCSTVYFDQIARKQIFDAIDTSSTGVTFLTKRYIQLKQKLGRIPTMVDFIDFGDIDPMLFIESSKKSYYRFLDAKEKNWNNALTEQEQLYIEFLSQNVANGLRLHEIVLLEMILSEHSITFESFDKQMNEYQTKATRDSYRCAVRILMGSFYVKEYPGVAILNETNEGIVPSKTFLSLLKSENFKLALSDILNVGKRRYFSRFQEQNAGLTRYESYTRRDIARVLNWDSFVSGGINVTGYPMAPDRNNCPIFITYEKDDDIDDALKYKDKFLSPSLFVWQSMHGDGLSSKRVSRIVKAKENGMRLPLFVKKQDNSASEFYYVGDVVPEKWSEGVTSYKGKPEPISDILFALDEPVQDDVYDYLIS